MQLIKQGKVKDVYTTNDPDVLEFEFSDRISVFDKIIPNEIPYKGETLCRTSAYWFKIAKEMGISTHYLGLSAPNKMRVRRVDVPKDYNEVSRKNCLIPLEFVSRYYVAGSLHDRIKQGEIKPENLDFSPDYKPKLGDKLPKPFLEVTTKIEKFDRTVTKEEALKISGLNESRWEAIWLIVEGIDERMNQDVRRRGLIHVDGKKEFAINNNEEIMLVDASGTADEDRFWDAKAYKKGELVDLSKEFVRQYYRKTDYYAQLMKARENGTAEPDIPPLPDDIISKVSKIYIDLFERITGEKFR